jgi:hypothetical protein
MSGKGVRTQPCSHYRHNIEGPASLPLSWLFPLPGMPGPNLKFVLTNKEFQDLVWFSCMPVL